MSFLLDTNVVSELRRPRPNRGVSSWFASAHSQDLYLSGLVVGEVRQGVERLRRRDMSRAEALDSWLRELLDSFADRIPLCR